MWSYRIIIDNWIYCFCPVDNAGQSGRKLLFFALFSDFGLISQSTRFPCKVYEKSPKNLARIFLVLSWKFFPEKGSKFSPDAWFGFRAFFMYFSFRLYSWTFIFLSGFFHELFFQDFFMRFCCA